MQEGELAVVSEADWCQPTTRVAQRQITASLLLPSADTRTITQSFTWDGLGNPATVIYPDDTGTTSDPARTVSFTYTNGFLIRVPGFTHATNAITYFPNGLVKVIPHLNGVTVTQTNDPNSMRRPASITTTGAVTNWSTGTYAYDGAGNIVKMGSDWFLYDKVSRLVAGNIATVTQKQCHVFDAFGNMLRADVIATGSTCPTTGAWSVDAATNRFLSPVTYFDTGNEMSWAGKTFAWDALNEMRTITGTGVNHTYLYTADGERIGDRDTSANVTTVTVRDLSGKVLRIMTKTRSND